MSIDDPIDHGDVVTAVRAQLADEEAGLHVPPGDVRSVVARGRRRQRSMLAGTGLAVVAVVAGVVVTVAAPASRPAGPLDVAGTTAADDGPSPSAAAIPLTPMAGSGPELVITTPDDGVVRWRDGATVEVPGLGADVEAAFPDGEGGIVLSRDDRVARITPDGGFTWLTVPPEDHFDQAHINDPVDIRLQDVDLVDVRLQDVDPTRGQLMTLSLYAPSEGGSVTSVMRRLDLDGTLSAEFATLSWEDHGIVEYEASLGDGHHVVHIDRGGGAGQYHVPAQITWSPSDPLRLVGVEVDQDGTSVVSLGIAQDGAVSLVRHATRRAIWGVGELIQETPLGPLVDPLGVTPVDVTSLSGSLVVLTVEHDDGRRTPALLDLDTGEVTLVDVEGTARLAPLDTP